MKLRQNKTPEYFRGQFQAFAQRYQLAPLDQEPISPDSASDNSGDILDSRDEIYPIGPEYFLSDIEEDEVLMTETKVGLLRSVEFLDRNNLIEMLKCQSQELCQEFVVFDTLADIGILKRNGAGFVIIPRGQFKEGSYSKTAYFTYLLLESLKRVDKFKYMQGYLAIQIDNFLKVKLSALDYILDKRMHVCFTYAANDKPISNALTIVEIDDSGVSEEQSKLSDNSVLARFSQNSLVRIDAQNQELLKYVHGEIETCQIWDDLVLNIARQVTGIISIYQPLGRDTIETLCKQFIMNKLNCMQANQKDNPKKISPVREEAVRKKQIALDNFCGYSAYKLFTYKKQWHLRDTKIRMCDVYKLLNIETDVDKTDIVKFLVKKGCILSKDDNYQIDWPELQSMILMLQKQSDKFKILYQIVYSVIHVYENLKSDGNIYRDAISNEDHTITRQIQDHDDVLILIERDFHVRLQHYKQEFQAMNMYFRRMHMTASEEDEGVDC